MAFVSTQPGKGDDEPAYDAAQEDAREVGEEVRPTTRFQRMAPPRQPLPTQPDPPAVKDTLDDIDGAVAELQRRAKERIGEVLVERFELRNVLGAGGAGAVFSAYDRERGERVAIKLLHAGLSKSAEHVARFEREARAATAIGHSSVVKVLSVVRAGPELFMVLELLDGEALFYAIEERRLSLGDILEIGRQLLGALDAAHARDIIHRDVKPENVFLCRDPSGALRVKLLDFGIAKMLRRDVATTFSTLEGMVVGTPHYMSPQMCAGEPATPDADIWAAGALLFHALAGRPPFDDDHIGRLLMRIVRDPAPSVGRFRPDLPEEIILAIDRALSHDPDERWTSARAFSDALTTGGAPIDDLDY